MKRISWLLVVCALLACGDDSSPEGPPDPPLPTDWIYSTTDAFPNLTFERPTDIQNAGDGSNRLFVTEQNGLILVFPNQSNAAAAEVFLDITAEVYSDLNSEMGLLGLVFHPQFESNGYFFVHYTAGTSGARLGRVSRFSVSGDPDVADPASEKVLLEFADDYANHNGGALCFGADGYLYIAVGDEGGTGDPDNNAQNRSRIFGKILRVDVNQNVDTIPYHGIPADNPYVGNGSGYREDIWAYGLRNPWRISFDAPSGRLVAGDVGQGAWEEVDIIEKGGNYGWDCSEGLEDYDPSSPGCATATNLKDPLHVYGRSQGASITGGYVYRGPTVTSLTGLYVYADYISGRIWALNLATAANTELINTDLFISTFGKAENGELFIASYFGDGTESSLYRLVQAGAP